MFSELEIGCLMRHLPDHRGPNDFAIVEKRLRHFVYDPSYESEFFRHNENRSIEKSTYIQAAARIASYSKGTLRADEI
jgi:hypothetical protein